VIVPALGAVTLEFTDNVYVALAAVQGVPEGLLVVKVIITTFPASPFLGVYVNMKGDVVTEPGLTEPLPFSLIDTFVALPPNVFPVTVTGVVPQVLPLVLPSVTVGPFTHCPNVSAEIKIRILTKKKALVIFNINRNYCKLQQFRNINVPQIIKNSSLIRSSSGKEKFLKGVLD